MAAEKTAEEAKAAGAVGRKVTAAQRRQRDSAIVARAACGWTQELIAAEFGITERQVRRVLDERGKQRSPFEETPMQLLEDLARGFQQSVGDFEAMVARYGDSAPNVALGAKKGANEARRHFMDLMATVGKLPTDLELFQQEAALQRVADEMVQIMQSVERGETSAKDAVAAFWRMTGRDADPTELPR